MQPQLLSYFCPSLTAPDTQPESSSPQSLYGTPSSAWSPIPQVFPGLLSICVSAQMSMRTAPSLLSPLPVLLCSMFLFPFLHVIYNYLKLFLIFSFSLCCFSCYCKNASLINTYAFFLLLITVYQNLEHNRIDIQCTTEAILLCY